MHAAVLKYFCAVARYGSIRRAADALNVANSAVGRQIQNLEASLGVELFERLPRGLRLTRPGEMLLQHARRTLDEYAFVESEIRGLRGELVGQIRIATLDSWCVSFLPQQVIAFNQAHPDVTFHVQSGVHSRICKMIVDGDTDFGISFNLPFPDDVEMVYAVPMPLMAMVAPTHPLAGLSGVRLADCSGYRLSLQLDTEPIRSMIATELSMPARVATPFLTSNNLQMHRMIIKEGLAVGFFTSLALEEDIAKGEIIGVALEGTRLRDLQLGILVPKRRRLAHAAQRAVERIGPALAAVAGRGGGEAPRAGSPARTAAP